MPLLRPLVFALGLLPAAAAALCDGPSLADRLTPEQTAEVSAAVAATPFGEGRLWTATRDGHRITIVGTMHLHDARHDALMARVAPAIDTADLVLVEATPAEEAALKQAMVDTPEVFFIQTGPTLPDLMPAADWDALAEAARDRGLPVFMAAKSQPWFLTVSLAMPPCAMPDLLNGLRGLDQMIIDAAVDAGVPLAPLEPWDTLPNLFAAIPRDEQLDLLRLSLVAPDLQSEAFVAMLDSYFAGNIAELWELSRQSSRMMDPDGTAEAFALTEDLLLDQRNTAWMPVIEAAAQDHDDILIAVGAGHLPGEIGLLNRLATLGWTVTAEE